MSRLLSIAILLILPNITAFAQDFWTLSNDGMQFGYAYELRAAADGSVYAMTCSGLHRSSDDGDSWERAPVSITSSGVTLTLTREGNLLLASHDRSQSTSFSTDHGRTWRTVIGAKRIREVIEDRDRLLATSIASIVASTDGGYTWAVVRDSLMRNGVHVRLLAATSSGDFVGYDPHDSLIVRSSDEGLTWNPVSRAPTSQFVTLQTRTGAVIIAGSSGVFRSDDGGGTWSSNLTVSTGHLVEGADGALYASAYPYQSERGIWRSTDDGMTWTKTSDEAGTAIAISSRGSIYVSGDEGLKRSRDGRDWQAMSNGLDDIHVYSVHAVDNGEVIAGVSRGDAQIVRSLDDGKTWTIINDSVGGDPTAIHVDNAGRIFAAVERWCDTSSIIVSLDDGVSWHTIADNIAGYVASFLETRSGVLFAAIREDGNFGSYGGNLFRSLDGGLSWDRVSPDKFNYPYRMIEARDGSIVVSTISWSDYLPSTQELHRSTDRGTTWTKVSPPHLRERSWGIGHGFAMDFDGRLFTCGSDKVFRSDDNGATWQAFSVYESSDSLWGGSLHAIAIDGIGNIFASACREGIFRSTDGGETWHLWNTGFVADCADYESNMTTTAAGTVLVPTYRNGFFRSTMPARNEGLQPMPGSNRIALDEPAPNPASDGATITINAPVECTISVGLWNVVGEDIGTVVEGHRRAGRYRVRIDTRAIANGVYFVVVEADGEKVVKRLIVGK